MQLNEWRGAAYSMLEQDDPAIELDLNLANSYLLRGLGYYVNKQFDRAIADYTHAIELEHNSAYFLRGKVYKDIKQYWQALQDYVQALELDPNHTEASEGKERVKKLLKLS